MLHRPAADDRLLRIRALPAAAVFGGVLGLAVGCAYLGGAAARTTTLRDQAQRLDGAGAAGFTEEAIAAAAGGLDAGALAIARRHDPYTVAGGAERDRQAELLTARLEQLRSPDTPGLRRVSMGSEAAGPFRIAHALDASRDLECLTQAAYYEARGEGREGMQAVAQVVLNRVRHPAFPKTVCGVVFQGAGLRTGCQFSFTCDGSMRDSVNRLAWDRARDVASRALNGAVFAGVGRATHFHTTGVSPLWRASLTQVGQVGHHLFYRFGGGGSLSSAFVYAPRAGGSVLKSSAAAAPTLTQGEVAYTLLVAHEMTPSEAPAATAAAQTASTPAAASAPIASVSLPEA